MERDDMHRIRAVEQKAALHRMLERNTRPAKAVAEAVGVAVQTLWGWADPSVDSHLPSARIPRLLMASDDTSLMRYWAGLQGLEVVSVPKAVGNRDGSQLAELTRAFAALICHHVDACADGEWSSTEVDRLGTLATELAARALAEFERVKGVAKVEPMERRRA